MGVAVEARIPPDGIPTTLAPPANTRQVVTQFAGCFITCRRHTIVLHFRESPRISLRLWISIASLSVLNAYPQLLRPLGLVFDVEVPDTLCPLSPQIPGGAYSTVVVQKVLPGFKPSLAPAYFLPATAYLRTAKAFSAAPATASIDLASQNFLPGDISDGFLALSPGFFHLNEIDLDGGLLKLLALADSVAFADFETSTTPATQQLSSRCCRR